MIHIHPFSGELFNYSTNHPFHVLIIGLVDTTAKFVAKSGAAFEEKIKRNQDKAKFKFLLQDDPFNAYYQHKVREIRTQLLNELESKSTQDSVQTNQSSNEQPEDMRQQDHCQSSNNEQPIQSNQVNDSRRQVDNDDQNIVDYHSDNLKQQKSINLNEEVNQQAFPDDQPRVRMKLNEYIQEMTMKLEEPPMLNFLATSAPSLTHMDSDIIKLTAQFISTYGRSFLLELVSREQNNSQFDFLKPQHGQFNYMTNLIMQYNLIQNQPLDILEQLSKDATGQKHILDKIKMRAEWNKMLELEQRKKEEAEEKEKILYSQIDWHDFVIVETIDYQPDERGEYPPTTADQVGTRLLLQQRYEEQNVPEEMEIDMDVESDSEEDKVDEDSRSPNEGFAIPNVPDDLMPSKLEKVVIRRDYDPKQATRVNQPDNYFVSPITNERVPVDKMHEHVRYNLSDPRYLEKKDQMLQERMNQEDIHPTGTQIQDSLKNLAERRTDIFGMNDRETAIGRRIGEEEQVQPKDDRLIWDGHKSSLKKKKLN